MHYPNEKYCGRKFASLPGRIAALQGSALIISTSLFNELRGFDEDYFLYGEDIDLCLRVRQAGRELAHILGAQVGHAQGHTEEVTGLDWTWQRKLEAEYIFYKKHYGPSIIRRISLAHRLKSGWVLFTQWLGRPFLAPSPRRAHSLAKYRAIWPESHKHW